MSGQNYTPEEQAAAYYAQQGYTPEQIAAATTGGYQYGSTSYASSSSAYPTAGSSSGYAGVPGAYETISVTPGASYGASGSNSVPTGGGRPTGGFVLDTDIMQQSSIYEPGAPEQLMKAGKAAKPATGKRATVIRKGNGRTWEDPSLLEWDPKWFRLFVADVSNDVNERTLNEAFGKYTSYCKCKVVKDRLSEKSKYAFIAFKDPEDMLKAWKEMDGKYIGNRPIRLQKVKEDKYGTIQTVEVSGRKARELDKLRKNFGKPLDGRPVPW